MKRVLKTMGRIGAMIAACLLAACAKEPTFVGTQSPLVFDKDEVARADTLAILVPGALAPIEIFGPAEAWRKNGYALAYYRFPGLNDLPLDHALGIDQAARHIAELAQAYPDKKIRLLGYSTGGPIVIMAAQQLSGRDVKVAAMSTAVERAGGFATTSRGAVDIGAAALRAGSFNREEIWVEYYRTLLFGRAGLKNETLSQRAAQFVTAERDRIVVPEDDIAKAHSRDLRRWNLPADYDATRADIRFFVGLEDPVFSRGQTKRFARQTGAQKVVGYADQGHLLFLTRPKVFVDILAYFEE